MRMKMMAVGGVMATAAAVAAAIAASAAPLQAQAAVQSSNPAPTVEASCNVPGWTDGSTFGITCSAGDPNFRFRAVATCENGRTVYGDAVGSGATSYAYCSSVSSTYRSGTGDWEVA